MKYILMCLLLMSMAFNSKAQMYSVTGTVRDEHGLPLPGCHVHYKDMCHVTDGNGVFIHSVSEGKIRFTFSFIGYAQKDTLLVVTQDVDFDVILIPDNRLISEIAVVGNGISTSKSKKKRSGKC